MTHADMFKGRQKRPAEWERPDCAGEPVFVYRGFWDDVDWDVHYCPECESVLAIVEPTHHWNHALTDPKPETLAEGRRLASIAAESKRNASQTAVGRLIARHKREQLRKEKEAERKDAEERKSFEASYREQRALIRKALGRNLWRELKPFATEEEHGTPIGINNTLGRTGTIEIHVDAAPLRLAKFSVAAKDSSVRAYANAQAYLLPESLPALMAALRKAFDC